MSNRLKSFALAAVLMNGCATSTKAAVCPTALKMPEGTYARTMLITDMDYDKDIVTIQDANGFVWEDDVILDVKYSGFWMTDSRFLVDSTVDPVEYRVVK